MAPVTKRRKKYITTGNPYIFTSIGFSRNRTRTYLNQPNRRHQNQPPSKPPSQNVNQAPSHHLHINNCEEQPDLNSHYYVRKEKEVEEWQSIRHILKAGLLERNAPPHITCMLCEIHLDIHVVYRCLDCGPTSTFCEDCLHKTHLDQMKIFHYPEMWNNGFFIPYKTEQMKMVNTGHSDCLSSRFKEVSVFDEKGRCHWLLIQVCRCEAEITTLLKLHLWPATPTDVKTAYSIELLQLMEVLLLECKVSMTGFCSAIRARNHLQSHEFNCLHKIVTSECFYEFRYAWAQLTSLRIVDPEFGNGTECAACPKATNQKIISIDANFGLMRRVKSGKSFELPKHGTTYFHGDDEVQDFVVNYQHSTTVDKECHNFQAGDVLRSKSTNKKMDITGVFGSVCRHESPVKFMDLHHGERLAYPVFLLTKLLEDNQNGQPLHITYDIACRLSSHLKRSNQLEILEKLKLTIPVFHCYGHKTSCQILYSPRRTEGYGLTDGEGIERLWSFLRRFVSITKEMTPSHRVDTLTDALLHYNRRKFNQIDTMLVKRYRKATQVLETANKDISEFTTTSGTDITEEYVEQLKEEEQGMMQVEGDHESGSKLKTLAQQRLFLIRMKSKYCDGQAVAKRLSKQINNVNLNIRKLLKNVNASNNGQALAFTDVSSGRLFDMSELSSEKFLFNRKLLEALHLRKRAEEEIIMLKEEMQQVLAYISDRHETCMHHSSALKHDGMTKYDVGLRAIVMREKAKLEMRIKSVVRRFREIVPDIELPQQIFVNIITASEEERNNLECEDFNETLVDDHVHEEEREYDDNDEEEDEEEEEEEEEED